MKRRKADKFGNTTMVIRRDKSKDRQYTGKRTTDKGTHNNVHYTENYTKTPQKHQGPVVQNTG
jgi:hypothetical protein